MSDLVAVTPSGMWITISLQPWARDRGGPFMISTNDFEHHILLSKSAESPFSKDVKVLEERLISFARENDLKLYRKDSKNMLVPLEKEG